MNKRIISIVLSVCMLISCLAIGAVSTNAVAVEQEIATAGTETASSGSDYGLADNVQDGQILQCWNWSYNGIKNNMKKIAEQGFTAVQTSPVQTIKETTQNRQMSGSWWVYYQPSNFTIDTSSQNALGTKTDFKAMCDEAHKYGVKVIVDAVLNHMANNGDNTLSPTIPSDIRNDSSCWYSITQNTSNWSSRWDITHNCMGGLPDLNTSNSKVQNYATKFLKECIDCGADGFRFDGAKHIEVPNDFENASSNFWPTVLNAATSYAQSSRGITPYYYGEILNSTGGGQTIVNQYANYMSMTANCVSNNIRGQVNSGNAGGAARSDFSYEDGSAPAANKAVLWNESHDTYANEGSNNISDTVMKKTWALVGSRAEASAMYFARPQSNSNSIGTASVTAWGDKEVQAVNRFKNFFAGESESLASSGSIAYNERGTSGVVLVNCSGTSASVNVKANKMKDGTYTDQITGGTFKVSGGQISGQIGSTGIAVVYNAITTPNASVTPGSSNYKTDSLTLTLTYTNATSGQYSIDGGAYQSFTNGQTVSIGAGAAYGTVTTVKVKASDGTTTGEETTYTYTKVDPTLTPKVYFDNSAYNWSSVYVYVYSKTQDGVQNSAWPGVQMQYDSATGYYVYEMPENLQDSYVIFTENETATDNRYPADQEQGMDFNGTSKLFKENHTWVDYSAPVPTTVPPTTVPPTTEPPTTVPPTTEPPTTEPPTTEPPTTPSADVTVQAKSNLSDTVTGSYSLKNTGKVTVTYKLKSSQLLGGVQWQLTYDKTKLKLSSANYNSSKELQIMPVADEAGNAIANLPEEGRVKGNFQASSNSYDFTNNGILVSIDFDVIAEGSSVVNLDVQYIYYFKGTSDIVTMVDSSVKTSDFNAAVTASLAASSSVSYELGDVNGDGKVNISDAAAIQLYKARLLPSKETFIEEVADINGDGKITINDAALLQLQLARLV